MASSTPPDIDLSQPEYTREGVQRMLDAVPLLNELELRENLENFFTAQLGIIDEKARAVREAAVAYAGLKVVEENPDSSQLDAAVANFNEAVDACLALLRTQFIQYQQPQVDAVLSELALQHVADLRQAIVNALQCKRPDEDIDQFVALKKEEIQPVVARAKGQSYDKNPALLGKTESTGLTKDQIVNAFMGAAHEARNTSVEKSGEYLFGVADAQERGRRAAKALDRIPGRLTDLLSAFEGDCLNKEAYLDKEVALMLGLANSARDLSDAKVGLKKEAIQTTLRNADRSAWLKLSEALSEVEEALKLYEGETAPEAIQDQRQYRVKEWELKAQAARAYAAWLQPTVRTLLAGFPEDAVNRVVEHLDQLAQKNVKERISASRRGLPALTIASLPADLASRVGATLASMQALTTAVGDHAGKVDASHAAIAGKLDTIDGKIPGVDALARAVVSLMPAGGSSINTNEIVRKLHSEFLAELASLHREDGLILFAQALQRTGQFQDEYEAMDVAANLRDNLIRRSAVPAPAAAPVLVREEPSRMRRFVGGVAKLGLGVALFGGGVVAERTGMVDAAKDWVFSDSVEEPAPESADAPTEAAPMTWQALNYYPKNGEQAVDTNWLNNLPGGQGRAIAVYCQGGQVLAPSGYPHMVWDLPHGSVESGQIAWEGDGQCKVKGFEALPQGQCLDQICNVPTGNGSTYNGPLGVVLTPSN